MKLKLGIIASSVVGLFFYGSLAQAATVNLVADKTAANIGDEIIVKLIIESSDRAINAAQGVVHFSPGVLQLNSVDRTGSIFDFWVEDPNISNTVGTMSFLGGTPEGVSGDSLNVLIMKFKATGAGNSDITFSDGTVAADDGLGTNILARTNNTAVAVSTIVSIPAAPTAPTVPTAPAAPVASAPVPVPQVIQRPAVPTGKLPITPTIAISSYPDPDRWYRGVGEVVAFWNVPIDVTSVAVSIDKNPNGVPRTFEQQLVDGKNLGAVAEGVWYAHVRFRNSVGLGPVGHHKISIDSTAPLSFTVVAGTGTQTDNPTPILRFETSDSLSGIDYYAVIVDSQQSIKSDEGSLTLTPQEPGSHTVKVIAFDKAGNQTEASLDLNILPIASPSINLVNQPIYSDTDDRLRVAGTALPNTVVLLSVVRMKDGFVAATGGARSDTEGLYSFAFEERLKNGEYKIVARAQDDRGALSFPVEFLPVLVKSSPILKIGVLEIGYAGLAIFLLIILIVGFFSGYQFLKLRQEKMGKKVIITKRDLAQMTDLLKEELKKMEMIMTREGGEADKEAVVANIRNLIGKIEVYISKEIEGISK